MIKKTLYFGNPVRLKLKHNQLRVILEDETEKTIPIEDIGFVIIDHYHAMITHNLLAELLNNNVAVITTNRQHLPTGWFMPLAGNTEQGESFRTQLELAVPAKKRIWQQTVKAKIKNQAGLLDQIGIQGHYLHSLVKDVASDDATNKEAVAAKTYWAHLFAGMGFKRHREGDAPNNLLNFGYAILRGVVARALCGTGLLPMVGVHHRNRYNAFPLADDIMEPYRPFVDEIVWNLSRKYEDLECLTPELKKPLLEIPAIGVSMKGEAKPLHLAAARTASSLKKHMENNKEKIVYPVL